MEEFLLVFHVLSNGTPEENLQVASRVVIIMMILVGLQNQMLIIMLTILDIIGTKLDEHIIILPIFTEDLQNL